MSVINVMIDFQIYGLFVYFVRISNSKPLTGTIATRIAQHVCVYYYNMCLKCIFQQPKTGTQKYNGMNAFKITIYYI